MFGYWACGQFLRSILAACINVVLGITVAYPHGIDSIEGIKTEIYEQVKQVEASVRAFML